MFLAFPSSEVFYVVAIILAWLYIALGIFGNYQATGEQVSPVQSNPQVQEHQIGIEKSISSDTRTFYWVNYTLQPSEESTNVTVAFNYHIVDKLKYRNRNVDFRSSYLDSNIPDRAPPSF